MQLGVKLEYLSAGDNCLTSDCRNNCHVCPALPVFFNFPALLVKRVYNMPWGRIYTADKAKVVAAILGTELIHFLAALHILHPDDLKKWINSKMDHWGNGCFRQMDNLPVHTIHQTITLPKWNFFQKLPVQIILAAIWLVRLSSASPQKKNRYLHSLL